MNIKKLVFIFTVIIVILSVKSVDASEKHPTHSMLNNTEMRNIASPHGEIVIELKSGETVTFIAKYGSWALVSYGDQNGYIPLISLNSINKSLLEQRRVGFLTKTVPMYAEAKVGEEIDILSTGEVVSFIAKYGSRAQVILGKKIGYIPYDSVETLPTLSLDSFTISADQVNVRSSASTSARILSHLNSGDEVKKLASFGSWLLIETEEMNVGFVHKDFLKKEEGPIVIPKGPLSLKMKNVTPVDLKDISSNNGVTLSHLNVNEEVIMHAKYGSWAQVSHNGLLGYVLLSSLIEIEERNIPVKGPLNVQMKVKASSLSIKDLASPSGGTLGELSLGDTIIMHGKYGSWAQISYNNRLGYVLYHQLEEMKETGLDVGTLNKYMKVSPSLTTVRNVASPNGLEVESLANGTVVLMHATYGSWAQISYNKKLGYVLLSDLTKLTFPESDFPELSKMVGEWDKMSLEMKVQTVKMDGWNLEKESYYLGYLINNLAYLYHMTKNEDYKNVVLDMVFLMKENYSFNGIIQSPTANKTGWWYRDQFSRDIRYMYEAYEYIGDPTILKMVDEQALLWLEKVPRSNHRDFLLFPYGVSQNGEISTYEINPNQNLQMATLFTYLYWDENSALYQKELVKDIVYNEVNAVLSLQKESGALPLREGLPLVEDSNYGGYAGGMLYHLAQVWGESKWIEATIDIGNWLYTSFPMSHPYNMPEDAPNFHFKRYESFNLIGRILPFYAAGIPNDYIQEWIRFTEDMFPTENLYMVTRWYYSQSIPREYLVPGSNVQNQLSPKIYVVNSRENELLLNVIAEEIKGLTLEVLIGDQLYKKETITNDRTINLTDLKEEEDIILRLTCEANHTFLQKEFPLSKGTEVKIQLFDKHNRFVEKLSEY